MDDALAAPAPASVPTAPASVPGTPILGAEAAGVPQEGLTIAQADASLLQQLRNNLSDLSSEAPQAEALSEAPQSEASPASPASFDIASLDPDTRKFVDEIAGGDLQKALAYAAAIAQGRTPTPETPVDPTPIAPVQAAPPTPQVQSLPPVPPPETVDRKIQEWLNADPQVREWSHTIEQHVNLQTQVQQAIPALKQQLATENIRMTIPEIMGDAYAFQQIQSNVLRLEQQINIAEQQDYLAGLKIADIRRQYQEKGSYFRDHYNDEYSKLVQQQTQRAATQEAQRSYVSTMTAVWPVALQRVAQKHNIPQELMSDLEQRIQGASFRTTQNVNPANLESFMEQQAVALKQVLDLHHRIQSGQYARQATARTAQSATGATFNPAPGAQAPAVPPQDNGRFSLEAVDRAHRAKLAQEFANMIRR